MWRGTESQRNGSRSSTLLHQPEPAGKAKWSKIRCWAWRATRKGVDALRRRDAGRTYGVTFDWLPRHPVDIWAKSDTHARRGPYALVEAPVTNQL